MSNEAIISCENLVKIYKKKDSEVLALQGLDLEIMPGEIVGIIGNSGSGKSTLLNMLGGLDIPTAGTLMVAGRDLLKFKPQDLIEYRKNVVGFVWQNIARNLIPYLTAIENIELIMRLSKKKVTAEDQEYCRNLLDIVGLSHRVNNKLSELSGGEQQRVAICIGLANRPQIMLADEPTGSVDTRTSDMILQAFHNVNEKLGTTIVIVTHDMALSRNVNRVVAIRDGKTSSEFIRRKKYSSEMDEMGTFLSEESHEELAVVDKSGRLQLPKEYLEQMGITGKSKVKVDFDDGKIMIEPSTEEDEE